MLMVTLPEFAREMLSTVENGFGKTETLPFETASWIPVQALTTMVCVAEAEQPFTSVNE